MKLFRDRRRWRRAACLSLIALLAGCAAPAEPPTVAPDGTMKGTGLFLIDFDQKTGEATHVSVLRSTGSAKLDATTMREFIKWRCKPGAYTKVKVPITYTMKGTQP